MLKIYLQIFGTIALCVILWFNYSVFVQKPMKAQIENIKVDYKKFEAQNEVLGNIIAFKPYYAKLEQLHVDDYKDVNVFFSRIFNEPRFMHKIQKMVDLSGCQTDGLIVGKITAGKKVTTYGESFKTEAKDQKALAESATAFIKVMGEYTKDSKKWQSVTGPDSHYANRLMFYRDIGAGKKYPGSMMGGFEIHRFQLTVKGPYNNCKKFLWLVSQNRPFTQVTVHSFTPITKALGTEKIFACRVTVWTYVDKNGEMQSSLLKSTTGTTPDVTGSQTKEPAKTGETASQPTQPETVKTDGKEASGEAGKVNPQAPAAESKSGK